MLIAYFQWRLRYHPTIRYKSVNTSSVGSATSSIKVGVTFIAPLIHFLHVELKPEIVLKISKIVNYGKKMKINAGKNRKI